MLSSNARRYEQDKGGNLTGFDANGRVVYRRVRFDEGKLLETRFDYDFEGNIIHTEDSDGNEMWQSFFEGNLRRIRIKGAGGKVMVFGFRNA